MSYFSYVGKLFSNVKGFYNEINAATLTGAIDAIIIQQEDGSFRSSPFHVRFGKLGVLHSKEKVVDIEVNGEPVDIQMKLGDSGEAFFVEEVEESEDEEIPPHLATSPLPTDRDLMKEGLRELKEEVKGQLEESKVIEGQTPGPTTIQEGGIEVIVTEESSKETVGESDVSVVINGETSVADVDKTDKEVKVGPKPEIKFMLDDETVETVDDTHKKTKRDHLDSMTSTNTTGKSDVSHDGAVELRTDIVKSRKKRRRRKKTVSKQKTEVNAPADIGSTDANNDANNGDIFEMEDLSTDDEMSRITLGMTKSVSMLPKDESSFNRTSEWATAHEGFKYLHTHPFSDTDLSPLGSPISSRPPTPKSDTEVERQKSIDLDPLLSGDEDSTLWEWGAMPVKPVTAELSEESGRTSKHGQHVGWRLFTELTEIITGGRRQRNRPAATDNPIPFDEKDEKSSRGLFRFMRKTKNVRHKPEEEGIYLDDLHLEDMDEETAKLYFPKRFSHSHFHSIVEKPDHEDDVESGRGASLPQSPHSVEGAIGGPSCSFLTSEVKHLGTYSLSLCGGLTDPEGVNLEKFMSQIVTYEDLCESPGMFSRPELVVRVQDNYYNWSTAAPIILSQIAFQKSLPEKAIQGLMSQYMPKKKDKKVYSWFSWRRGAEEHTSPPNTSTTSISSESGTAVAKSLAIDVPGEGPQTIPSNASSITESPKKLKVDRLNPNEHSSSEGDTEGSDRDSSKKKHRVKRELFKKSLRLTSQQIKQLNLQLGQNEVTYSVTTQYQGTKSCTSHIYLWKHDDKIIVSDIDGTITKSDVLGQILPIMGRDWSQSGVAQLYSRVKGNGYKFLYLSARAIGQAKLTKDLLRNIKQGDMILPEGPLLLSPTSLISAFHREVIAKKPEEFKISCLKDIGSLFPPSNEPFYAGFGNKVNDVYAYKAINIPIFRIFTINPYGELKHELSYTFQTSYTKLTDVADHFFPPLHKVGKASEYNQVQYWRDPLPDITPLDMQQVVGSDSSESKSKTS